MTASHLSQRCAIFARRIATVATLVLLANASGQDASTPPIATVPRIRISPDGRTFQTSAGKPFVPCGVNYYRPGTGWAPQVWKQFDAEATRADFARLKQLNLNCVRVFLSYGSFYRKPGVLEPAGLAQFDQFLRLAEEAGIYVHPAGLDHWEGMPEWKPVTVEDEGTVEALERFWELFAARYRGRSVIFAYDLKNEPEVGWQSESLTAKWRAWVRATYTNEASLAQAWHTTNRMSFDSVPVPAEEAAAFGPQHLADYQAFRESLADEWTRRQAASVKRADPEALVTVGLIQWSVPALLPAGPRHYSAFNPQRQARFLDFLEIHFYPLAEGAYRYRGIEEEEANLAYLEAVVREVARPGKPVVLAEFGWFGGGKPTFSKDLPEVSEAAHARYCRRVLEVSSGWVVGWLNWGFYDHPQASDCSQLTGLLTAGGEMKEWGREFQKWAAAHQERQIGPAKIGSRPSLDWRGCVTRRAAGDDFRKAYLESFRNDAAHRAQ